MLCTLTSQHTAHPRRGGPVQLAAAMRPNAVFILAAALAVAACGLPLSSALLPIIWELNPQFGLIYGTTTTASIQTTLCGNCDPATAYATCNVREVCHASAQSIGQGDSAACQPVAAVVDCVKQVYRFKTA